MNKKLVFKINGETVVQESTNLTPEQIEALKYIIVEEMECKFEDIIVSEEDYGCLTKHTKQDELGEIESTAEGLINWKSCIFTLVTGVELPYELGSDRHLDAISKGTVIDDLKLS